MSEYVNIYEELGKRLAYEQVSVSLSIDADGNAHEHIGQDGEYTSTFTYPVHLVLFGGGHIAQSLVPVALRCGLNVTVIDDRMEMKDCFPPSTEFIHASFDKLPARKLNKIVNPYFCIFTHGHSHDSECLYYCLKRKSSYIGMIGSKNKIKYCFEQMKEKGISEKKLSKVHSPIGLAINAVTPQEIAVSILGEIISVYRKEKNACIVSPSLIKTLTSEKNCVICRVLKASGSTPAREGQILIVYSPFMTCGTIGGGALEEEAREEAARCTGSYIKTYDLSRDGELGMTCGGEVTVLFSYRA